MKTIGLIGGMSWESSALYYQQINQKVKSVLGGHHSAECILYSLDFSVIAGLQHAGDWDKLSEILVEAAINLERAGADFIALCTNTMHKVAPEIQSNIKIPFLHIGSATAKILKEDKIKKAALLGTKFTMEQDFLKNFIVNESHSKIIIPNPSQRDIIHQIIYDELVKGMVKHESKLKFIEIINSLRDEGAQGIILGCTEIGMLVKGSDVSSKLYDTTSIHAEACALMALEVGETVS